jgi:hypothetical protein
MVDEVFDEHASKTSASLPMLPLADKQQQQNSSLSKGLTVLYLYRAHVKAYFGKAQPQPPTRV